MRTASYKIWDQAAIYLLYSYIDELLATKETWRYYLIGGRITVGI